MGKDNKPKPRDNTGIPKALKDPLDLGKVDIEEGERIAKENLLRRDMRI